MQTYSSSFGSVQTGTTAPKFPNSVPDAALWYREVQGFSVIPVSQDKNPLVKWTQYQQDKPSSEQIKDWWREWPSAMVAVITGDISGICVVDIDDMKVARETLEKCLPLNELTICAQTPRGGYHRYYLMPSVDLRNNAGLIPKCDLRANGGCIIAPPSVRKEGAYTWLPGLGIHQVKPAKLPESYIKFISTATSHGGAVPKGDSSQWFQEGRRDQDAFHVALGLRKGGVSADAAEAVMRRLAPTLGDQREFNDEWIRQKIDSAWKHNLRLEKGSMAELREWIIVSDGVFSSKEVASELGITGPKNIQVLSNNLNRLLKEGVIERAGTRNGVFRKVQEELDAIDFINAPMKAYPVEWPLQLETLVKIFPGNIAIIAGESNSGKTAFLLNLIKLNQHRHPIHYFNSEMGSTELKVRLSNFQGMKLTDWKFGAWERTDAFADVIRPDAFNIIDYIEVVDEFWKIAARILEIHKKLKNGIAVVAIQKRPGSDLGMGGAMGTQKPRLYLSMAPNRIKIIKGKIWSNPKVNPNGLIREFSLVGGSEFIARGNWRQEEKDGW